MSLSFARPELLLALAGVPALVWLWARDRRPALRYSTVALVAGLPRGRAGEAVWGRAGSRGAAVALLLLAAAGPRVPDLRTAVPVDGIALVLALDVSGSMAEPDYPGPNGTRTTRLAAAKAAFAAFVFGGDGLPGRPADRVGLVAFAELPRTVCPPTLNHDVLAPLLAEQAPAAGPGAGTSIGDAVAESLLRLEATARDGSRRVESSGGPGKRVLVLLTDGEDNAGGKPAGRSFTPLEAARLAQAVGVPVYCVDCGADDAADPERRAAARKTLARVADLTGGRSFRAADAAALRDALAEVDALERSPAAPFRYRRYRDLAGPAALAGLLVLAAGGALERTRWRVTG